MMSKFLPRKIKKNPQMRRMPRQYRQICNVIRGQQKVSLTLAGPVHLACSLTLCTKDRKKVERGENKILDEMT